MRHLFDSFQDRAIAMLESLDGRASVRRDAWSRPTAAPGSGLVGEGVTGVMEGGAVFERAGASLSAVEGDKLPPSATVRRPELAGRPFTATGVSVVIHPHNPYCPTSHMNVRLLTTKDGEAWWVGGGFDLTPFYPFDEDVRLWHEAARDALQPFSTSARPLYPAWKERCDEYFTLKHRGETRGVGGIFFDDVNDASDPPVGNQQQCLAMLDAVVDAYVRAYTSIIVRRKDTPFGERERAFQLYRRGRYVEFNLVLDRGTHFGLQSGGRTESILTSMPPLASWRYDWQPEPGSPEARLGDYLRPRDWLSELPASLAR